MNNRAVVRQYERICSDGATSLVVSGRYPLNSFRYPSRLAADLVTKLALRPADSVLDLGCNIGIYHDEIAARCDRLVGVDASTVITGAARRRHPQRNVEYLTFDITQEWPIIPGPFTKVLVYSVIHFLEGVDDLTRLIERVTPHLVPGGRLMLGEVRTVEKRRRFLEAQAQKRGPDRRDIMFWINRRLQRRQVRSSADGQPPTLYSPEEISAVAAVNGMECIELDQQSFHPFSNTCSDFLLQPRSITPTRS